MTEELGASIEPVQSSWSDKLHHRGLPTELPTGFLDKIYTSTDQHPDRLTGLPIEDDTIRTEIAKKLDDSIKSGKNFACIYADVDNLKTANGISRTFGDEIIRSDAARVCSMLDGMNMEEASLFVVRQTHAADETVVWVFDLTDEQLRELREKNNELNRQKANIETSPDQNFTISTTAAMVDSQTAQLQEGISATKQYLEEDDGRTSLNFLKDITEYVDNRAKMLKIAKDIARLPVEQLGEGEQTKTAKVIDILSKTLGGSRISEPLLRTILTITASSATMEKLTAPQEREAIYETMGVENESDVKKFLDTITTEDLRITFYDMLLHNTYEEAGMGEEQENSQE
jgi:GGDEF domain-containing protein